MTTTGIIVIGAGGHGAVVVDAALAAGYSVLGLTDAETALQGTAVLGIPVIGGDDALSDFEINHVRLVLGIGSIKETETRRRVFEDLKAKGYTFATIIHPRAIVGQNVEIGEGSVVMAGAVVQPRTRVAENVIINTAAQIDHDGTIGAHCHIAPGAVLSGTVTVGAGTHLGAGVTVIQGTTIGTNAVIAAGSVVISDVAAGTMVAGNPARRIEK